MTTSSPIMCLVIALVIGDTGQDGRILSQQLSSLGYDVLGVSRSRTQFRNGSLPVVNLHSQVQAVDFLSSFNPNLIFHVAAVHAPSHPQRVLLRARESEMISCHVDITKNLLHWAKSNQKTRIHVALSSQMFSAESSNLIVNEKTHPCPINFYGETKRDAWNLIKTSRDKLNIMVSSSILFNHSSIYARDEFVLSHLRDQFVQLLQRKCGRIELGNPFAMIDMSSALEICDGMLRNILFQPYEDFVLASGKNVSLASIVIGVIRHFNLPDTVFQTQELPRVTSTTPSPLLIADTTKARKLLNWSTTTPATEVLSEMVLASLTGRKN